MLILSPVAPKSRILKVADGNFGGEIRLRIAGTSLQPASSNCLAVSAVKGSFCPVAGPHANNKVNISDEKWFFFMPCCDQALRVLSKKLFSDYDDENQV